MQDLINCLEQDHDLARTLMNYFKSTEVTFAQKRKHFDKFSALILNHIKSEEDAVYTPSRVLKNPRIHNLIHTGLQQHFMIRNSITRLKAVAVEQAWSSEFSNLNELIEFHLDEEESEFFPELKRSFSKEQFDSVTEHYYKLNESNPEPGFI